MSARILMPSTYVDYHSSQFLSENTESISNHLKQVQLTRQEHGIEAALIEVYNKNSSVSASAVAFKSSYDLNSIYHITGSIVHLNSMEEDLDFNNLRNLFAKYISGKEELLPVKMYVSIIEIDGSHYFKYILPMATTVMLTAKSGFDDVPKFVEDCSLFSPFDSLGLDIAFATGVDYSPIGFSKYDGQMGEEHLTVLSFTLSLISTYNKLLLNCRCGNPSWATMYLNEVLWFAVQSAQQLVDTLRVHGFHLHLIENSDKTLTISSDSRQVEAFDLFSVAIEGSDNANKLSL